MKNGTLRDFLDRHKKMSKYLEEECILKWSQNLLVCLKYMKENKLVHNHIQPKYYIYFFELVLFITNLN